MMVEETCSNFLIDITKARQWLNKGIDKDNWQRVEKESWTERIYIQILLQILSNETTFESPKS